MKLRNHLTEAKKDMSYCINLIEKECRPFLKNFLQVKPFRYFLFSGRTNAGSDILKRKIRTNRRPADSMPEVHRRLDYIFDTYFKIKPRSMSLFCTSDEDAAESYGVNYIIFPQGNYKILWSPRIGDLYTECNNEDIYGLIQSGDDDTADKRLERMVTTYKMGDLKGALNSGNEIMVMAKGFIGFRWDTYIPDFEEYFDK